MSQPRQLDPLTEKLVEALASADVYLSTVPSGGTRLERVVTQVKDALRAAGRY